MPECFLKAFGRSVAVLIDCFEVRGPTPSGLLAKAQTYSHYKKNSTVKLLIGITPQGTVSYISEAWGGRTSGKFITEHSKEFLDKLIPGDVVLADRGFDIGMVTGQVRARVVTPAFMHGRSQLSADDVEYSRSVANVRIHVERLIGLVRRKFQILEHRLNFSMLQHGQGQPVARIDDVVVICCAISNLCNPIVPMTEISETN
ncbi:Ribosomal RNA small subunit methyltransferase G [Frankliniella fusca]|uniref:Ribosomal RNA small subunit methyltransferase G n=1 Tax=Frankliniella fusca TaxID=407009 RepID=A0AAE1HC40_9NEOP|nr:Ribosomal RNA small subunit methyltransferase G [Frankliniella fusca]